MPKTLLTLCVLVLTSLCCGQLQVQAQASALAESAAVPKAEKKAEPPVLKLLLGEPKTNYSLSGPMPGAGKPAELTSEKQAKKYFKGDRLKRVTQSIDWSAQKVLVFYWHGSGGDRLESKVVEGKKGPKVQFSFKAGRTKDLRAHLYVFAIRKGVPYEN